MLKINKLCTHTIKCGLANKLFDNYCHFTCAKDLWDELNGRYGFEDEGVKNLLWLNICLFKCVKKKLFLAKLKIFKNSFKLSQKG